ncbi:MAG: hypothetical protein AAGF11_09705 [Myxococcota bacterium]
MAVRTAAPPHAWPQFDFLQVKLHGAMNETAPCYFPARLVDDKPEYLHQTCASPYSLVNRSHASELPTDTRQWAKFLGTLDQVSAVYSTQDQLEYCARDLPTEVPAQLSTLGKGMVDGQETFTFVEYVEAGSELTAWLESTISFDAVWNVQLDRRELWLSDGPGHPAARSGSTRPPPPESVHWPVLPSSSRWKDRRPPRAFPLWPTPVTEPCPPLAFDVLTPALTGGPIFERVLAHMTEPTPSGRRERPDSIKLLRHHVGLPGLHLVAALFESSYRHHHSHCFVSADAVYCDNLGSPTELERLVEDLRLEPQSLTPAAWFELVLTLTDIDYFALAPKVPGCDFSSALEPSVEIEPDRVTVRVTSSMLDGGIFDRTIVVGRDGTVSIESRDPRHRHAHRRSPAR